MLCVHLLHSTPKAHHSIFIYHHLPQPPPPPPFSSTAPCRYILFEKHYFVFCHCHRRWWRFHSRPACPNWKRTHHVFNIQRFNPKCTPPRILSYLLVFGVPPLLAGFCVRPRFRRQTAHGDGIYWAGIGMIPPESSDAEFSVDRLIGWRLSFNPYH